MKGPNFSFGNGAEKLLYKRKWWFLKKFWKKLKNSAPGAYIVAKTWDPDSGSPKIVHSCSEIEGFGELGGILWHRPRPPNSTHTGGLRPRSGRRGGGLGGERSGPPQRSAGTDVSENRASFARELPPDRNIPPASLIDHVHLKCAIAAKQ